MTIWKVSPVAVEAETRLADWQVAQLPDGARHLVGYAVNAREGRTSSRIVQFDFERLRAVTSSGRVYELVGPPGYHSDAQYVWERWQRINSVVKFTAVTAEVWAQHIAATESSAQGVGPQP
jgi:hypothetical protein